MLLRPVHATTVAVEKQLRVTYSECVSVVLVTQHPMRMRCIILPSVTCLTLPYFPTLPHKRYNFQKEILKHFFLSNATTCPLWTSWSPLPVVAEV
jgi:hypothetical protein